MHRKSEAPWQSINPTENKFCNTQRTHSHPRTHTPARVGNSQANSHHNHHHPKRLHSFLFCWHGWLWHKLVWVTPPKPKAACANQMHVHLLLFSTTSSLCCPPPTSALVLIPSHAALSQSAKLLLLLAKGQTMLERALFTNWCFIASLRAFLTYREIKRVCSQVGIDRHRNLDGANPVST